MTTVKSNIGTVADRWAKEQMQKVEGGIRRAMQKTALVGEARVRGAMEKEAYDTGALLRSVVSSISEADHKLILRIGSNLDYAWFVEHGRKPGKFPNLDALVAWTGRKLKANGVNTRINVSFDELKQLARSGGKPATAQQRAYRSHLAFIYLVGRKIATKGIRGKLIFARIEDGLLAYFRNEVQKELNALR
jgi:hypothetical protein